MLSIRRMTFEDLDDVIGIENSVFGNPWSRTAFESILNHDCFVLIDGEKIAGYICCICVLDECSISNVAITPGSQGKGFGNWLMKSMMQNMKEHGINVFYLEVRRSNERALFLYEKLGFRRLAIRKNYYINPQEDAIVMAYAFDPGFFRQTTWTADEGL